MVRVTRYPKKVVLLLERVFAKEPKPNSQLLDRLVAKTNLSRLQLTKWFSRKRLEQRPNVSSAKRSVSPLDAGRPIAAVSSPSTSKQKPHEKNAKNSVEKTTKNEPPSSNDSKSSEINDLRRQVIELRYRLDSNDYLWWQHRYMQQMTAHWPHYPSLSWPYNNFPPAFNFPYNYNSLSNLNSPLNFNPSVNLNSPLNFNPPVNINPPGIVDPSVNINPPSNSVPQPPPPQSNNPTPNNPSELYQSSYSSTTVQLVPYTNFSLESSDS